MFDYMLALNQLTLSKNPIGKLGLFLGTKNVYHDQKRNQVGFNFKMCKKASVCNIYYDEGKDLYRMEFRKRKRIQIALGIYDYDYETVKVFEDVYCDQLKEIFESFTGLYLSLS
jgi:hypothetical protein